jgi:lysyl endopeptidase
VVNFILKDGTTFNFDIQTDNYANENSWEILNSQNEIIQFEDELISNELNNFSFCQDLDSCYTLVIYDDYNDGMCCDFGNGYVMINGQIFDGDFNSELLIDLCTVSSIKSTINTSEINIYPNPSSGNVVVEALFGLEEVRIYNILGKIVLSKHCNTNVELLNLHRLEKGTYTVQINSEGVNYFKKIILQ